MCGVFSTPKTARKETNREKMMEKKTQTENHREQAQFHHLLQTELYRRDRQ